MPESTESDRKVGRSMGRMAWLASIVWCGLLLAGCAAKPVGQLPSAPERPLACMEFFKQLDAAVGRAEVEDASTFEVSGFPYLRSDRFLAAVTDDLEGSAERRYWLELMMAKGLSSRKKEIKCLPAKERRRLAESIGVEASTQALVKEAERCSEALMAADERSNELYSILETSVTAPPEYSLALRTAGLYPLASLPVAWLTARAHDRMRDWQKRELQDFAVSGRLVRWMPETGSSLQLERLAGLLDAASHNPLDLPQLGPKQAHRVAERFAPVLIQDVAGEYDRLGRVCWQDDRLVVDGSEPTLYYYLSFGFLQDRPVLQVNYTGWYPARRGSESPWIERGRLDGLTVRVSLDQSGEPFMVDIMNNCGCYHFFVPDRRRVVRVRPRPLAIDAFVPTWLPETFPERPLTLRMNSGWHQVQKVTATDEPPGKARAYRLRPYQELERLRGQVRTESMFDPRGIAKGSERIEPLLLFSMGIPEVGAMRQRNHHPLKLVGRAHFADPRLFERSFEFREEGRAAHLVP